MKLISLTLAALTLVFTLVAQSPQKMSYQAVVRNNSGQIVKDQTISLKASILQGSVSGNAVYTETHKCKTNINGLFSILIGDGVSESSFSMIDWSNGEYFIKTEIDLNGGTNYTITGTTQLLSVPYSFYSSTSETVKTERQSLAEVIDNMNSADGQIKDLSDPTDMKDAVNKEYVTFRISKTGDTLTMGNDQSIIIPGISTANVKAPKVSTLEGYDISNTSASFMGEITDNGWSEITEYGFEYSTDETFENGQGIKVLLQEPITKGTFSAEVDSLTEDMTYYYKAFATNEKGTAYGELQEIITHQVLLSTSPNSGKVSSVIGKGYNIAGLYANSFSIKASVLDYNKMNNDSLIFWDENQKTGAILSASGSTSSEYQGNMSSFADVKASYGGFSGEVKARYEGTEKNRDDFSFATHSSKQIKKAFLIDKDILFEKELLYPYLTDKFKTDIMTKDTAEIWEKYGTDVLLGGMWGGRADYNMLAQKRSNSDGKKIGVYVSARYESVFGSGSGKAEVDKQYSESFETSSVFAQMNSRGGNNALISGPEDFKTWAESINDDNEVFMEFYPGTVVPIYEFIEDPVRREEIRNKREEHLKHYVIPVSATTIPLPINNYFENSGFTKNAGGDNDVNSKSGRNTLVNVSISIKKNSAHDILCTIYLGVKEEHSDNTEFKGSYTFLISSDNEILDFAEKKYSSNTVKIGGSNHDYVSFQNNVTVDWIRNLQVQFDSNHGNDQPYIGIKGTINFVADTRSPLE
jgi:hypothetical protein